MLGVQVSPDTVWASDLKFSRFLEGKNLSGFGPSTRDPYTVYLIWEDLSRFNLNGCSIVRAYEDGVYKAGFKRGKNKALLLYTSFQEGKVAVRMWLWCASKNING